MSCGQLTTAANLCRVAVDCIAFKQLYLHKTACYSKNAYLFDNIITVTDQ